MALLSMLRAALARGLSTPRRTVRRTRLALQTLESRDVPAVGGGFPAGGLLGEYFDNRDLAGTPAFTRQDVRIDFDWQTRAGRSISRISPRRRR